MGKDHARDQYMGVSGKHSKGIAASGILWRYDYTARVWRYDAWSLRLDAKEGYILTYPEGAQQVLRHTSLYGAMVDAAFWIRRYNGVQG